MTALGGHSFGHTLMAIMRHAGAGRRDRQRAVMIGILPVNRPRSRWILARTAWALCQTARRLKHTLSSWAGLGKDLISGAALYETGDGSWAPGILKSVARCAGNGALALAETEPQR
jgi:hypothetical protein